ncbi:putative oxidoreductase [Talaromyces proteolyticus]|uniref:Oxidoreductase n=1 Tax=Talaromyces proteolyticus TaxID=1131652 RepID=A0AAD4KVT0_9EURO|nr:putative oxidoreductase [Talaromyces proteolyticus]KAH8700929.1 putative oxidoreductase [Talaromyces proteolyticus]
MKPALKGWHPGEVDLQRKLGFSDAMRDKWASVKDAMSEQHRIFHTSNLHFIPITTLDDRGRPWGSLLAGNNGSIGFAQSPNDTTLSLDATVWNGDPLLTTVSAFADQEHRKNTDKERFLIAGIGVEHSTRRRNKFAGRLRGIRQKDDTTYRLDLEVTQALGNCPKYINVRNLVPHADTHPVVVYRNMDMAACDTLPEEIVKFVTEADTVFLSSVYKSTTQNNGTNPSHAGMNIRGGLPGFIRVDPSDARTVVIPDYSGNRFMSSLGNIVTTPVAGLTIVDFKTGDVLYLTGTAQIFSGPAAMEIMARQACLTTIKITGYTLVRDALPVRQEQGTPVEKSPYSPKIKYLRAEPEGLSGAAGNGLKARLVYATQYASDIAIFRFDIINAFGDCAGLTIRPGQAVVLDFMDWMGPPTYSHMANDAPSSINDDRVRTWTVSSAFQDGDSTWIEMTMREVKKGAVTGSLFDIIRENTGNNWGERVQLSAKNIIADIVGVTGDFYLGTNEVRMLWVAGGIGVTPFMSMLTAIIQRGYGSKADIVLALATREPEVFIKLIKTSLPRALPKVRVRIDVFTNEEDAQTHGLEQMNVDLFFHKGRISMDYWPTVTDGRDVFICGPGGFGDAAEAGIRAAGVPNHKIYREGFY